MRMKGLRALWTTAARRLRAQEIRELQQAARRLARAQPDHLRAGPVPGVIKMQRKGRLADASGERAERALLLRADVA